MKTTKFIILALSLIGIPFVHSQDVVNVAADNDNWSVFNRQVSFEKEVIHLDANENDGILWLKNHKFKNGTIEFDIKGKNTPGRSFVGFAFHGVDNETFDAIYFRPFNFKNPEKKSKSVQYVSMPENGWAILRETYPGKYENEMTPTPDIVDDWFHVKIEVLQGKVKVYVNGSGQPTLEVDQISSRNDGNLGFWVGNGSEGWFKNLKIKEDD